MGKRVGLWDISCPKNFDYTLVSHTDYEYYQLFQQEEPGNKCQAFKLKSVVKRNPEIFAWYLAVMTSEDEPLRLDERCQNSSAGYVVSLVQEFLKAFNTLNIEACCRIQRVCSNVQFSDYHIYKVKWILEQLTVFANILRKAFVDSAPVMFSSEASYKTWWEQSFIMQASLNEFGKSCDLEAIRELEVLKPLSDLCTRLAKGVKNWNLQRGLNRLEAASGYFLALAHYWFKVRHYQTALLFIHRSLDCLFQFFGYQERLVVSTTLGLKYNDTSKELVSLNNTYKRLKRVRSFTSDESNFITSLNQCRNNLRETHGFYVAEERKVWGFLRDADEYLKNSMPDTKSYLFRQDFDISLRMSLKSLFYAETGIDSYFSKIDLAENS